MQNVSRGRERPFFESFVFSEIFKSYTNAGIEADFYYLRDGNYREIDLIIREQYALPDRNKNKG